MNEKTYCIKRKISDLEMLILNITTREIENNMTKICDYLSKQLYLGKHEYKFENNYHEMSNTHTIRMYFKFEKKLTSENEKFIENLKISRYGNLIAKKS